MNKQRLVEMTKQLGLIETRHADPWNITATQELTILLNNGAVKVGQAKDFSLNSKVFAFGLCDLFMPFYIASETKIDSSFLMDVYETKVDTRTKATYYGLKFYYPHNECAKHAFHEKKRYTSSGLCVRCCTSKALDNLHERVVTSCHSSNVDLVKRLCKEVFFKKLSLIEKAEIIKGCGL